MATLWGFFGGFAWPKYLEIRCLILGEIGTVHLAQTNSF